MAKTPDRPSRRERISQIREAFRLTRQSDPRLVLVLLGAFVVTLAVFVVVGILLSHVVYFSVLGVIFGAFVVTILFGRRASRAAFSQVEGQPGAAAAVLQNMRGDWRVTPAVAFNRHQDLVHRAVGRPGVLLVGEGSPRAVSQLLAQEKRKVARVAVDTPIYDLQVGDAEGQIPLRKLQSHVMKLPRNLKSAELDGVESRMRAIGGSRPPIPQGPMPQGARIPRGKMR